MVPDVVATLDGQNPGCALNGGNYTSLRMCVTITEQSSFIQAPIFSLGEMHVCCQQDIYKSLVCGSK